MTLSFDTIHRENQGKAEGKSHEVQLLSCYADREAICRSQPLLEAFDNSQIMQLYLSFYPCYIMHKVYYTCVLYFTIAVCVIVVA